MKRFLPIALLSIFVAAVAWILLSEDPPAPQTEEPDTPIVQSEPEEAHLEAGPTRLATEVEEEAFDPRGIKIGAGRFGLHGTVVDEEGTPLGDMWVAAYSVPIPLMDFEFEPSEMFERPLNLNLEPLASTMADGDGKFVLEGLPGRGTFLVARGNHHLTRGRQPVLPEELDSEEGVLLHTVPGAVLEGQVQDASGAPVIGAEVFVGPSYLYLLQAIRNRDIYLERVFTDGQGRFRIDAVPAHARLSIAAIAAPTRPGMSDIGPLNPGTTVQSVVRITSTGALQGRVVDEEGEGVSGAKILAIPMDLRMIVGLIRDLPGWTTESGSDGKFTFPELPQRSAVLLAQGREGRSPAYTTEVVGRESSMKEEIVLRTSHTIRGRLVDLDGSGIADARVFLNSIPTRKGKEEEGEEMRSGRGIIPSADSIVMEAAREVLPELLPSETWVYTDSGGRFELSAWDRANLRVETQHHGEANFELPGRDDEEKDFLLVMMKPGSVRGRVVDAKSGEKLSMFAANADLDSSALEPDVDIEMLPDEEWRDYRRRQRKAREEAKREVLGGIVQENDVVVLPERTSMDKIASIAMVDEESGEYRIDGLLPGTWQIEIRKFGYINSEIHVEVESEKETQCEDIRLSRGATLSGQVVAYGTREPVAGAIVSIGWNKGSGWESFFSMGLESTAFTRSDKDGYFTLSGITPGMEWVSVMAEGFSPTAIKGRELEEDEVREGVVIQVRQGATIQGFVYDRHGQPLPNRMVGGFTPDSEDFWQTSTDAEGFYRTDHVRPGNYFILTAALDAENLFTGDLLGVLNGSKVAQAFAREGETLDVDLVDMSANGCRFTGQLLSAGAPLAGGALILMASDSSMFDLRLCTAEIGSDGHFEFASVAPGKYRLQIESPDWRGALDIEIPDADEDYQVLSTPMGLVRGRVLEQGTGNPVPNASVRLVRDDSTGGLFAMFTGGNETDWGSTEEDGSFEFTGKVEGRYHLEVEVNDWGGMWEEGTNTNSLGRANVPTFHLMRDGVQDVGDVLLPIASQIRIQVSMADGEDNERGFTARAIPVDEESGEAAENWGWGKGATITGLSPGTYDVQITGEGLIAHWTENVQVGHGQTVDIEVTLEKGLPLRGRFLDSSSQPVLGASVTVLDGQGQRVDSLEGENGGFTHAFGSEDGSMPLGAYAAGTYTVRVDWDGDVREQTVTLRSGDPTLVEFQF